MTTKSKTRKAPTAKKRDICTIKQAAELDFSPAWTSDQITKFPTPEQFNNPHLINCRLAVVILGKTKPEVMALFDGEHDSLMMDMVDNFQETRKFFMEICETLDAAHSRLLVACASVARASQPT